MIVYGLKNCDTCRKVLKLIPNAALQDVRADGVPAATLEAAFEQFGEKLLNTRSTTWRGLDADARAAPPLDLIRAHPALMKRPLIDVDGVLYLGWDASVQKALT
ncbi:arsenate reductase [Roseovarius aestuarii]|nr:arsenate reductase [Roseovarius aestuarii]